MSRSVLFQHCVDLAAALDSKEDPKCSFCRRPPIPLPTANYKTSSKNRKSQTFYFPPMAQLFIAALLISADRRQSQSSRKFAWTELHLSWSWWEAEGAPVHSLTLQPAGMLQPHWGICALTCSAEQTHPKVPFNSNQGTPTMLWNCTYPIIIKILIKTDIQCSEYII